MSTESIAPDSHQRTVRVDVRPQPYDVIVGSGLVGGLGPLIVRGGICPAGARVFLALDANVPSTIVERVVDSLAGAGLKPSCGALEASESEKTLVGAERLLVQIARTRHERAEPVVAMGGGIVGDVVGFAAAIYRRGVPVVQCPTTLLGMVDAAVGGKTAVNLDVDGDLMKNLVGAFHQPRLVIADVSLLDSLPDRQLACGLAECIKHGMIGAEFGEPSLLDWLEQNADAIFARETGVLVELVARNVALKAAVVANDEREEIADGGRALLNLGHTFGHAVETIDTAVARGALQPGLHHGEAVALGLIAAAHCATAAGLCSDRTLPERITQVVERCRLPAAASGLPSAEEIMARMAHDKKVRQGVVRLVLPTRTGCAELVSGTDPRAVIAGINSIRC